MFAPGDVIEMFAPQVGTKKYLLCVCAMNDKNVQRFFFINSGSGYEGDFPYPDKDFAYLPASPTGKSVVSCSYLLIHSEKELKLFQAKRLGAIAPHIVKDLLAGMPKVRKLPPPDRALAIAGLKEIK